jgi:hypothetical protein
VLLLAMATLDLIFRLHFPSFAVIIAEITIISWIYCETNYLGVGFDKLQKPVIHTETATPGPWIDPLHSFPDPRSISPVILFVELLFPKTT